MRKTFVLATLGFAALLVSWRGVQAEEPKIPIIYFTDLFHPAEDQDDHFDLACLFALKELDVKAIILDNHSSHPTAKDQRNAGGRIPLGQMMHITGRKVPWAIGLKAKLRSRDDKALDADAKTQEGIKLMMSVLRNAPDKSVVFKLSTGCDFAAAFNRDPDLFKKKVKAIYFHAGNGPHGSRPSEEPKQWEYNVSLDPIAYERVLESGVPIYWCPCFEEKDNPRMINSYQTAFAANLPSIFQVCDPRVQKFFAYVYAKSKADPIAYLDNGADKLPSSTRLFWSPPTLAHAAGRNIYQRGANDYVFLTPSDAARAGLADKIVSAFEFAPVRVTPMRTTGRTDHKPGSVHVELKPDRPNAVVFHQTNPNYQRIVASCMANLIGELGRDPH